MAMMTMRMTLTVVMMMFGEEFKQEQNWTRRQIVIPASVLHGAKL